MNTYKVALTCPVCYQDVELIDLAFDGLLPIAGVCPECGCGMKWRKEDMWLKECTPQDMIEGEQPQMQLKITVQNFDTKENK